MSICDHFKIEGFMIFILKEGLNADTRKEIKVFLICGDCRDSPPNGKSTSDPQIFGSKSFVNA